MATNTSIEVTVTLQHDGYKTRTVRGKSGSCAHNAQRAVERLGEKLFPDYQITTERLEFTSCGRVHSKWRITPGAPRAVQEGR